jgi:hypothetical protein
MNLSNLKEKTLLALEWYPDNIEQADNEQKGN